MNNEKELQKLRALKVRQNVYWESSVLFRDKADRLDQKISDLTSRINQAIWDDIDSGDVLTNGKKEVTVTIKIDQESYGGRSQYLYVEPDADIDGNRDRIYKDWLHLDGFATGNGWRKKQQPSM